MKAKNALLLAIMCSVAAISSVGLIAKFYFKSPSVTPRYTTKYKTGEYKTTESGAAVKTSTSTDEKRYDELIKKEKLNGKEKQELENLEEKLGRKNIIEGTEFEIETGY